MSTYLRGVGRLIKRSIARLFDEIHGVPISTGAISKLEARTSQALQPFHDEALAYSQGRDANVDETSWKQGKDRAWLWVAVTRAISVFLIRRRRNR